MQLLSVLPAQSGRLLPPSYRELMTDQASPLAEFYPRDFEVDLNGKTNSWEAIVKIPFIDEQKMIDVLTTIDHARELTPQERLRNLPGIERKFVPQVIVKETVVDKVKRGVATQLPVQKPISQNKQNKGVASGFQSKKSIRSTDATGSSKEPNPAT